MNVNTQHIQAVLAALNRLDGHPVGMDILSTESNYGEATLTHQEVADTLAHLQSKGWADYNVSRLHRGRLYYITAEGRIIFREEF